MCILFVVDMSIYIFFPLKTFRMCTSFSQCNFIVKKEKRMHKLVWFATFYSIAATHINIFSMFFFCKKTACKHVFFFLLNKQTIKHSSILYIENLRKINWKQQKNYYKKKNKWQKNQYQNSSCWRFFSFFVKFCCIVSSSVTNSNQYYIYDRT